MGQNNNNNKEAKDRVSASKERKIEDMEGWRNKHGQPSFRFLKSLADDGSPAALEKLRYIADDLDVSYNLDTPIEKLIERIRSATRNDPTKNTR
jgi:hypothetical protein